MEVVDRVKALLPASSKSWLKIGRARAAELVGSSRWQNPALDDLVDKIATRLPLEAGVFLEIGGSDGYSYSNTYYLERHRGWRGILIEPLPDAFRICRRHRSRSEVFNYACVAPMDGARLVIADRGPMAVALGVLPSEEESRRAAGALRFVEVPTTTLSGIIDRSSFDHINFMVIDVEGAELHVLAGLDLDRHAPDLLLIETDDPERVAEHLAGHMVYVEALSRHDYLFVKGSNQVAD